ncbi:MAG: P1 family peptidase [Caldilineaceae bacterium]
MNVSKAMPPADGKRGRFRDLGLTCGILPTGPLNAITDVADVRVGHVTLIGDDDIRTGATAILPHAGNLYQEKVPAGVVVGNGYGKLMGSTQIQELGEIETPILLTNTLAVPRAADAILDWTLGQSGNEAVVSVNMVVGETNDSYLNNIRRRVLTPAVIGQAIATAQGGPVAEGCVGAGTGTVAFGWKGGIGTSSRCLPLPLGGYTVGVLVQSNYGGVLQMAGVPVGQRLGQCYLREQVEPTVPPDSADGSIMIIVATDAPWLTAICPGWQSGRWPASHAPASMSNGSGDYVLAFSTAGDVRRSHPALGPLRTTVALPNEQVSPLFQAVIEATEEAIYNSLCMATTMAGYRGHTVQALPLDAIV